jgi:RNA polymerase sigma-70 factor (ECF subfamily)
VSIPDIPEKELLGKCLRGDKQAWNLFVLRYSGLIRHALYHTLAPKNPPVRHGTINDLYQDVFVSLMEDNYRRLRQFRGKNGCSLANWIRVIAVRKAIDHLRKGLPTVSIEGDLSTYEQPFEYPDGKLGPEEELIQSEEIRIIAEVIKTLPPRHQFFIELYYHRELSTEEISEIMGLKPNAVYQLNHRIKERIREILANDYPEIIAA